MKNKIIVYLWGVFMTAPFSFLLSCAIHSHAGVHGIVLVVLYSQNRQQSPGAVIVSMYSQRVKTVTSGT
jgi:hypothetical protein